MSLLTVKDLSVQFNGKESVVHAARNVNFTLEEGEIVGVVGESGSGKSVTMKAIMGLLPTNAKITSGEILFETKNILDMTIEQKRKFRGKDIAMIFQDPMTALNPLKTIGYHLEEVLIRHKNLTKQEARLEAIKAISLVGIQDPERRLNQYPHEFSGGMRQRVMIAMALSCSPKLLIADEPTTALDVTIQSQILDLIRELKEGKVISSVLLITHDLGVVAQLCKRVVVLYGGMVMESGTVREIFYNSNHPYTKALLNSLPKINDSQKRRLEPIQGTVTTITNPLSGCPFASRCNYAQKVCFDVVPVSKELSVTHTARCHFSGKEN